MTHSIPDSSAVALGTELGTVLITGDYKFDQTPVDGAARRRLAAGRARPRGRAAAVRRLDERRPRGLLAVGVGRRPAPGGGVRALPRAAIVVTSFASNIHRVQQVVDAAAALGRKVALVGRSMRKNVGIGRTLGHIDIPEGMLVGPREIDDFPDERIVDHLDRLTGRAAVGAAPDGLPRPPARSSCTRATRSSSRPRRSPATSARSTRRSTGSTTSAAT